jgi:hypothetical protein
MEVLWKWMLRLAGLGAFAYVLIHHKGEVPVGVYVIIGGLIGLPNVITWQNMLNQGQGTGALPTGEPAPEEGQP